jgi:hypothetical protein
MENNPLFSCPVRGEQFQMKKATDGAKKPHKKRIKKRCNIQYHHP